MRDVIGKMSAIAIDDKGRLNLPTGAVREIGASSLELVSSSERHLLLSRADETVIMAGSLGSLTAADLLSFLNMFRMNGVLHFDLCGGTKGLYFQNGEIIFATSSFPEEEIGEILFGLGKIDRDTLLKSRQLAVGGAPIGKILMEKSAVTPKDVWLSIRLLVENIVYHLFSFQEGNFCLLQGTKEEKEILNLSLSTQNLIMEGLRRVDERALFRRRIPSLLSVPVLTGKGAEKLSAAEARLAGILNRGGSDVREVLRRAGMGEFEGLRILYQLIEKGAVRLEESPPEFQDPELEQVLCLFNGALTALFRRVVEKNLNFGREIRTFLRDLPQPYSYLFRDNILQEDGSVDPGRILANLAGLGSEDQKRLLVDGLNELVFWECLIARRELGAGKSADLVQRVQEISKRMKSLVGRKK